MQISTNHRTFSKKEKKIQRKSGKETAGEILDIFQVTISGKLLKWH